MSNQIILLKNLLEYIEEYEKVVGNTDVKEFSIFLKDRVMKSNLAERNLNFQKNNYLNYKKYPQIEFSTLLTGLFRFAKHYLKKAFYKTSFKTIDEFGFLASLLRDGNLLKNELFQMHLLEMSSGSEILKRMIKNKLIYEYPDEDDRRAKRVALTENGKKEIFLAFDDMYKVSEIIIGNLSEKELSDSLSIFNKLTYFHRDIHQVDKETPLTDLHKKYVAE